MTGGPGDRDRFPLRSRRRPLHAENARGLALIGSGVLLAGLLYVLAGDPFAALGPLSHHMAWHIALMNAAAPLAALALLRYRVAGEVPIAALGAATALQTVVLWGWHLPHVLTASSASPALGLLMHGSLFAVALYFWVAVFSQRDARRWSSIVAVLVTGKLVCLLGALLIFAPRALFAFPANLHGGHHGAGVASLDDQQLAGLMMVIACPLTYVLAGVVIAARWLDDLDAKDAANAAEAVARTR